MKKVVAVAMSGGVDSSVTAALLKEQGYEVFGVTMKLWDDDYAKQFNCSAAHHFNDAREVAKQVGIKHYLLDFKDRFKDVVIDSFIDTYLDCRTPNPCVTCNINIKFGLLLEKAKELGADYLATGHYVQAEQKDGLYRILKGKDPKKDQSYFLYHLTQDQLRHLVFPLGAMEKPDVRALAEKYQLKIAQKPESQDVCFLGTTDYREFIDKRRSLEPSPGNIVDTKGNVMGTHKGLSYYTIGQRRGLGVSFGEPVYVIGFDIKQNELIVGTSAERYCHVLKAGHASFVSGVAPTVDEDLTVKVRYASKGNPARLQMLQNGHFLVQSTEPLLDVTSGQSVVLYKDNELIGGGIIEHQITE